MIALSYIRINVILIILIWIKVLNSIFSEIMKILRVVSDLYPFSFGGLGVHVHELSKAIVEKGHEVTVFTCAKDSESRHGFVDGYEYKCFKPVLKLFGNTIAPSMLTSLLKSVEDFDVVHAHSHLFFSTNLTVFVRKLRKTPLVVTNHGLVSQSVSVHLQKLYLPTIAKLTFLNADAVICYSSEMVNEMKNWGMPSDNVRVIHNGTNAEIFRPFNENNKEYDIIWIGRYVPGKGVEYLINSLGELKKEFKNLKVLMIGIGPLREFIKKKVSEMGLINNINFIEKIPNYDIPSYYNKSKLFVLTSLEEGVPRTLLEAMSCGLPVVCSNLPQLKKLVYRCGILVDKKDVQGFVNAIARILNDRQLAKKLGRNGRMKILEKYLWDDTVNKTLDLYKELIS